MFPLLPLLLMLQPTPPPPTDRVEAALALWRTHPPSTEDRQRAARDAVDAIASTAINDAKAKRSYRYFDPLRQQLRSYLPAYTRAIDQAALECLAEDFAWHLSADDLRATQAFVATPAGARFWDETVVTWERLGACYRTPVAFAVGPFVDAELKRLGLKRPQPDPRVPPPVN